MSEKQEGGFWALVELFGHQQLAGFVSSQTVGGQSFVRVDVPETKQQEAWTKLYGPGAIYAITPITEELARQKAAALEVTPIKAWDLPREWQEKIKAKALPAPDDGESPWLDEEEEDDEFGL